jgi:hypothetical protein
MREIIEALDINILMVTEIIQMYAQLLEIGSLL